mgnify:CR=1 FL=1
MIQTGWQGPGCHLLRMANISKQAYQSYKHIANKKHTPHCAQRKAILNQVQSVQLSLPKPPSWQQVAASPPWAAAPRRSDLIKNQGNRWAKFSSVAQPIITPWPPIIKGFMPLMPLTPIRPIIIIGCAPAPPPPLPNACCNVRCLFAAWSTGMSSTTDTIDALDQYWHKRPLISKMTAPHHSHMQTGIAVSRACMASMCQIHCVWVHVCFAHFFIVHMPMFLFFLNIVIYPRVLTMSQYVSKCLNMSQYVSKCLNLHFWAILSWSGRNKIWLILSNLEQFRAISSNFELIWVQQIELINLSTI